MADQKKTPPPIPGPLRQYAAPQILLWGSIVWEWIGRISNVDFLMSIQPQGLREAFQLMFDYGVWIIAIAGALWWIAMSRKLIGRPTWPQTVAAFSIMSFLWGV